MASRLVLHVGAMKSGTSYLQAMLFANKELLAQRGVLVAGESWADQTRGVRDALGHPDTRYDSHAGAWEPLVEAIHRHDGTSVVSFELLGSAVPEKIAAVLSRFDDVRVVVTARDLNRNLVSMWQETLQNGHDWTLTDFVEGARRWRPRPDRPAEDRTPAGALFWRQQGLVRICRNWSVASGGVALVTVPAPGQPRGGLLERFMDVVGVSPEGLREPAGENASLGLESAEVLRLLNRELASQGLEFPHAEVVRKWVLAKRIMSGRRAQETAIGLEVAPWVQEQAQRQVDGLRDLGIDLVGGWDDLTPSGVRGASATGQADLLGAAVSALAGMVEHAAR